MDVWTLELRPGVREEYASPAWLAALVIFVLWNCVLFLSTRREFFFIPYQEILTGLFIHQPTVSKWGRSASDNLFEFEVVTMVITDYPDSMTMLGQRWPMVVRARWPNIIKKALAQCNFAHRPYVRPTCWFYVGPSCWPNNRPTCRPYVGPTLPHGCTCTLAQHHKKALAQCNFAHRPYVRPTCWLYVGPT